MCGGCDDVFRRDSRRLCNLVAKMFGCLRSIYDARRADQFVCYLTCARYCADVVDLEKEHTMFDVIRGSELDMDDQLELMLAVTYYVMRSSRSRPAAAFVVLAKEALRRC